MNFFKQFLDDLEIDFVGRRYQAGYMSIGLVLLSWALFVGMGPNWGIDFTGGTEIQLRFDEDIAISEVRDALRAIEVSDDAVQEVSDSSTVGSEFVVRIQDAAFGMDALEQDIRSAIGTAFGENWLATIEQDAEVGARFVVNYSDSVGNTTREDMNRAVADLPGISVQSGKEDRQYVLVASGLAFQIEESLRQALKKDFEVMSIDAVGPKVGGELRRQGFISILATLVLVLIYVAFRFDLAFAPGAIIALFHDVSLTIGIFVALQIEFSLPIIGALLTIVGYSLNDTIVIYDRIRENQDRYRRRDLTNLINGSINETLTRTAATSITTMLAIMALIIMGGSVIKSFAFAMLLGIIFGTYSTVFVASPLILFMEDIKPKLLAFLPDIEEEEEEVDDDMSAILTESISASEQRRQVRAMADREER